MFGRNFESILAECIDTMRLGATVDDCLARYPQHARRLRPQLQMASLVSRTPLAVARPEAEAAAWRAVQKRVKQIQTGSVRPRPIRPVGERLVWLKPVAITAVLVGCVSAAGGGMLYAAQDASPDSSLYTVKLTGEDIRLWFVFDDERKAEILLDQSEQRMEEISEAVRDGKAVPGNALSDMDDRNQRAADILAGQPDNTVLRSRVTTQAEEQEQRLLAFWPQVHEGDRDTYAEVVTNLHNIQLGGGIFVAEHRLRPEALSGGILPISGLAEQDEDGTWRIGGFEIQIDERTLGYNKVQSGAGASVLVARSSNGQLQALTADIQNILLPPTTAFVTGAVEDITSEGITVAGQFIPFSSETIQLGKVKVGEHVQVSIRRTSDGVAAGAINQYTAEDEGTAFWFEGTIEEVGSLSWVVGGLTFQISDGIFEQSAGSASTGARAYVEAEWEDGELQAGRITVLSSQAAANTITLIGTFQGYDSDEGVWTVSEFDITPPEDASPDDDPALGSLVLVDAKRDGDSLIATDLEVIREPDSPAQVRLEGPIQAIDGSHWTLESTEVRVGSTARVIGKPPEVGKRVIVWATQGRDGLDATFARILDQAPVVTPAPAATPAPTP